jgi:hypothetical protein
MLRPASPTRWWELRVSSETLTQSSTLKNSTSSNTFSWFSYCVSIFLNLCFRWLFIWMLMLFGFAAALTLCSLLVTLFHFSVVCEFYTNFSQHCHYSVVNKPSNTNTVLSFLQIFPSQGFLISVDVPPVTPNDSISRHIHLLSNTWAQLALGTVMILAYVTVLFYHLLLLWTEFCPF